MSSAKPLFASKLFSPLEGMDKSIKSEAHSCFGESNASN